MFTDHADIGIVISGLRRYNLFTAAFFLGRHHRLIAELARLSGAGTGDQALDIGCGPGKLVRALGDMVGPEGGVVGVDPSETAVAYNRRRDRSPNHRYEQSVAQQLNQLDAAFDIITCTFVMHHIPEQHRVAAVEEMWRVLRPGGRLLLADAHPTVRARSVFAGIARLARRGSNPHDTFDAVDIRQYSETLVAVGFATPHFVTSRYSTGILIAEKPDLP
ncbi:hypothetical protein B0T44_23005 [Nocardia donostiensis]|uniref:Methyltransferase domain-containing protein n=2 Tax=Nocardia donostiensis TaxID=1538463 RepID=A0A1W0B5N2_9NOCA|nr:hypothetical protein B0T46_11720 [Nocardia donostiensis]OQS16987.1 hypothetical protein B0T36_04395 [Nocardia donostiensis]OQS17789.1 hypothetical protein B0T44_23005 [Nocardia donostiensis]